MYMYVWTCTCMYSGHNITYYCFHQLRSFHDLLYIKTKNTYMHIQIISDVLTILFVNENMHMLQQSSIKDAQH